MRLLTLLFILVLTLFATSCKNTNDEDPVTKASIIGYVNLYDEGTTKADNAGMTVRVEGLSPEITAVTNVDGKYILADVPFGLYNLVYEKTGFGTFKKNGLKHIDLGSPTIIAETPSLGQISTTKVTGLNAITEEGKVIISATSDPAGNTGNKRYLRFFYAGSQGVSSSNYTFVSQGMVVQINPYTVTLSKTDLTSMGFSSGNTVYVKAYGDSFWSNEYTDPVTTKKVFPNLNVESASAVSFVVP